MDTNDQMSIGDNVNIDIVSNQIIPLKKEYEVVSKAGLFKNGKQYNTGDKVELNEQAAKNFLASGDIKEVE